MKRIFLIVALIIAFAGVSVAQDTKPKDGKKAGSQSKTSSSKSSGSPTTASSTAKSTTAGPAKKDGTPDMRYKTNKDAAKTPPATVHTKKDGTPDKRYKENKKAG